MKTETLLTPKELAARWGATARTVRTRRKMLAMRHTGYTGSIPLYPLAEVERAERAWAKRQDKMRAAAAKRASARRTKTTTRPAGVVSLARLREAREEGQT